MAFTLSVLIFKGVPRRMGHPFFLTIRHAGFSLCVIFARTTSSGYVFMSRLCKGKVLAGGPVALAVHDLVGTMRDSVEGGCAQQFVVEGVVSLREVEVAGDDRRFSLVALCDDVVEVLVLPGAHGLEAEVIDDEQIRLGQSRQFALVGAHGPCRGELPQELGVGGEHRVVAATYGDVPQGLGKVALAGAAGQQGLKAFL